MNITFKATRIFHFKDSDYNNSLTSHFEDCHNAIVKANSMRPIRVYGEESGRKVDAENLYDRGL